MAAGENAGLELRALTTIQEFEEAVELQKVIWGFADIELLPRRLFVVANKIGGQTLGAFDGERMVAFLIAIPGVKSHGSHYLHSHMLGTLREYRDRGLGRQLKLMQREDALARGFKLVEWTFDPLEIKNAFFNMERLGAIVRRFVPNQYGTTSSHLHGGLPTDRFLFLGFVPRKKGRQTFLAELVERPETCIFLESPHRLPDTLERLAAVIPERPLVIARELSKIHEEFLRLTVSAMRAHFQEHAVRGEFVLLLEGKALEGKRRRRQAEDTGEEDDDT